MEPKIRILYSHFGIEGKAGWGRSFYMAKALANLGHEVVFMTNKPEFSLLFFKTKSIKNVKVICFPEFLPKKIKSAGFGTISLIFKVIYSLCHKFDLVISDCGHRPTGLPCRFNRLIYNSVYITEWWDYFGEEGYYKQKSLLFRTLYGWIEKWSEIYDKKTADGVIVLSSTMKERALKQNIKNLDIIPGGSPINELNIYPFNDNTNHKITFGYIGMKAGEVTLIEPFLKAIVNPEFQGMLQLYSYGVHLEKKVINDYSLEGIIQEKGWIDYFRIPKEIADVDIFVHIHIDNIINSAGWPNKLGDYLALGRPIMISPYGDLRNFISENPKGFITVDFNCDSVTNRIREILNGDYNLPLMGMLNRNLSEKISWEKRAEQVLLFYIRSRKNKL